MKQDINAARKLEAAQIVIITPNAEIGGNCIDVRFNTEINTNSQ